MLILQMAPGVFAGKATCARHLGVVYGSLPRFDDAQSLKNACVAWGLRHEPCTPGRHATRFFTFPPGH